MKILILWAAALCSSPLLAQQGITGIVRDAQSQKVIQDVIISVPAFQIQVRSDARGMFSFPFTWSEQQALRLKHPDYEILDTLVFGNVTSLQFELQLGHMTTEERGNHKFNYRPHDHRRSHGQYAASLVAR